ncbi:hypothetical protein Q5P01_014950 [Channa striata]|uniref:Uncharacterized protein n=1 Tax=Channa striata TaxID=64152 RepID=A0AA88MJ99_CHASR|nr:hypothetical protein Q5P01_014950 [Channa striata]
MSRRESRGSRGVNRELEDMRRQMEAEMKEMEEKMRTAAKIMVLKERDIWQQDREQLLEENRSLQKQLSIMKEDNRNLQTDLQKANEEREQQEEKIISLHKRLLTLEKIYSTALFTCSGLKRECEVAEEEKMREQLIISLQQSLSARQQGSERVRGLYLQCEKSSGFETVEDEWRRKDTKRVELKKGQAHTRAHVDTLAELTETQSALKQNQLSCVAVEEKLQTLLAEKEERFRKELSGTEQRFRQQLSKQGRRFKKELSEKTGEKKENDSSCEHNCLRVLLTHN